MTPETKDQPTQSPATSSSESDKFNTSVTTKNGEFFPPSGTSYVAKPID